MSTENFEATNREKHRFATLLGDIQFYAALVNLHTDHAVFIDYSGHVDQIWIRVTSSKQDYHNNITSDRVYTTVSQWVSAESIVNALTSIKMNLKSILIENKIPYEYLDYSKRVVEHRDYHLAGGWKP